jgi:hypothetical protein
VRLPRWIARLLADLLGFFWLPCPRCGVMFAGFESGDGTARLADGTLRICCKRHDAECSCNPWPDESHRPEDTECFRVSSGCPIHGWAT